MIYYFTKIPWISHYREQKRIKYIYKAELTYCKPLFKNTETQNNNDGNDSIVDNNLDMPLIINNENDSNINKVNNNMNELDININSDETNCINDSENSKNENSIIDSEHDLITTNNNIDSENKLKNKLNKNKLKIKYLVI